MNITLHPAFDLSLNQLMNERKLILEYNKTTALKPEFKLISTNSIDRFIQAKKVDGVQLETGLWT